MNMKVGGWNINYFFYLVGHESSLMLQASCEGTEGYLVLPGIKIIAGKGLKIEEVKWLDLFSQI